MQKKKILLGIFIFHFSFFAFHFSPLYAQAKTKAIYVCNEGLMNHNNGALAYYNFETGLEDLDFFTTRNKRGLGDTPNDMKLYGSKIYIVVTLSSQVEVLNAADGKSVKQIRMFSNDNKPKQPRNIAFYEGKAYVSSSDGTVTRIDTATLNIEENVRVGRNSEGICAWNGKLYVANSGGLDAPNYDNTVSVVDIASFTEEKKIIVGANPYRLFPDEMGNIYLTIRGDYDVTTSYAFKRIRIETDEVTDLGIGALNFSIYGDYAYVYNYDFSKGNSWIKLYNLRTQTIERENFITDGTTIRCPYNISINPLNSDVYICDAGKSFVEEGDIYCFDKEGRKKNKYSNVGLNPNAVVFINEGNLDIASSKNQSFEISVYPNPVVGGKLFIKNHYSTSNLGVNIYNCVGNLAVTWRTIDTKGALDIAHLPAGIYFVEVKTDNLSRSFKIIKQ